MCLIILKYLVFLFNKTFFLYLTLSFSFRLYQLIQIHLASDLDQITQTTLICLSLTTCLVLPSGPRLYGRETEISLKLGPS